MSIDNLQIVIMFGTVIVMAALASCFYRPKMEISLDFRDFMVFLSIVLIGVGFFMLHPASAFIVSGSMLFWVARPR